MSITIKIEDKNQLKQIEQLRGRMTAEAFAGRIVAAGLAEAERRQIMSVTPMNFSATKPEFKTLDVAAITEALKDKDANHPVKLEVSRLVGDYSTQLSQHAKANGNKLPKALRVNAGAPIEKVAFQITMEAIKHSAATARKKATAE